MPSPDSVMSKVFLFNKRLSGNATFVNTIMAISKSNRLGEGVLPRRMEEVQGRWRALTHPNGRADAGAQIIRWELGGGQSAKKIIQSCLGKVDTTRKVSSVKSWAREVASQSSDPALLDARHTDIVIP